jgi:hypothetical protein
VSRESLRTAARVALACAGLGLVGYFVHGAGPGRVGDVLLQAGPWLPLIVLLELAQPSTDVIALRYLLARDASKVPFATWARSSAIAYAMMSLVPAGRVAGEVTRAALIATHVGAARAASASARMQSAYLFANGVLSATACAVSAAWLGPSSILTLLLAGNTLMMFVLSTALLAILWHGRVGRWLDALRRRFVKVSESPPGLETAEERRVPWQAAMFSTAGRACQALQYGVILHAVGGAPSVHGAFLAHGIHLVGATAGDMVPNQLGVIDGVYKTFAPALGFAGAPARALSIAFVAHITQLLCASLCVVGAALTRGGGRSEPSAKKLEHPRVNSTVRGQDVA